MIIVQCDLAILSRSFVHVVGVWHSSQLGLS